MTAQKIVLDATSENLTAAIDFVNAVVEEAGFSPRALIQISVAVEEIFMNIALYAYAPEVGKAQITVEILDEPRRALISFKDEGVRYNPLEKPDPDTALSAEERQIGGLGIFMVKKSMDDMTYEYKNGSNVLTLTKRG